MRTAALTKSEVGMSTGDEAAGDDGAVLPNGMTDDLDGLVRSEDWKYHMCDSNLMKGLPIVPRNQ